MGRLLSEELEEAVRWLGERMGAKVPPGKPPAQKPKWLPWAGFAALVAVGVLMIAVSGDGRPRTQAPPPPTGTPVAAPSPPSPVTASSTSGSDLDCDRAVGIIARECSSLPSGGLEADRCSVRSSDTHPARGDGKIVRYRVTDTMGPVWFVDSEGRWWTVNGIAATWCPRLEDVSRLERKSAIAAAPARGTDARSYEGLYDKTGSYKHADCSAFELEVADAVYLAMWKNPQVPAEGERALRELAKRLGLPKKTAEGIHYKAMSKCDWKAPKR